MNCLLDVYVTNSTSAAGPIAVISTQRSVATIPLPTLNVTALSPTQALVSVDASSASVLQGGPCTSFYLTLNASTFIGINQTQCYYVLQYGPGTSYSPVSLSTSVLQSMSPDAGLFSLVLTGLQANVTYGVRLALLVKTGLNPLGTQTAWTAVSLTTPVPVITPASLCLIFYALPGNVDYPWSSSISLTFEYDHTLLNTTWGQAVALISGGGIRTYTNRFGVSVTTPLILSQNSSTTGNLLYLGSSVPVDSSGLTLTMSSPIQLPGAGHQVLHSALRVYNSTGVVVEDGSFTIDGYGQAFLSSLPGFNNVTIQNYTIGASNVNSLAADYIHCVAPITFTNGLRPPTQPSSANGAARFSYSYHISDGLTYTVQTNLSIQTQSAFASHQDGLGNPYQVILNVTGMRVYTYLPHGRCRLFHCQQPYQW